MLSRFLHFLFAIPILFLTSCIEGEEEIWIDWDASGKIRAHYEFPPILRVRLGNPKVFIIAIRDLDKREEGIEIQELFFEQVGSKLVFHLEATFGDVTELQKILERNADILIKDTGMDPAQSEAIVGSMSLAMQGLNISFQREILLDGMFPERAIKNPQYLGSSNFRYQIHLPFPVKSSNAHAVTNDGKSLEWIFLLKEHTQEPLEMSLNTRIALPWWIWAIAIILILIVTWLIWRRFFQR
ncbi:hypothetical protein N9118_07540 [Akkermansiaceae bacterium]|jgi:hypothetical protein|nr:hypothetical protein [bacterium]MDB4519389.1 hypothetical protein [Akkermansiaceae bacterium]|tara:strand:+ start:13511 stop:14233 length:723 start_codon:yes stop_codon:yes gene_type:complete